MTLPQSIEQREYDKFEEVSGTPHVKVTGAGLTGSFYTSGLQNGGRITEVSIDNLTWTALPATALTDRNAIAIQNDSGQEIKVNFDNTVVGYVGMKIPNQGERAYDIKDSILIYAKSSTSACTVTIEEIS